MWAGRTRCSPLRIFSELHRAVQCPDVIACITCGQWSSSRPVRQEKCNSISINLIMTRPCIPSAGSGVERPHAWCNGSIISIDDFNPDLRQNFVGAKCISAWDINTLPPFCPENVRVCKCLSSMWHQQKHRQPQHNIHSADFHLDTPHSFKLFSDIYLRPKYLWSPGTFQTFQSRAVFPASPLKMLRLKKRTIFFHFFWKKIF